MNRPQPTQCIQWHVDIGEAEYCTCDDCLPACPVLHHEQEMERLIQTTVAAQTGIINLRAYTIACPHRVSTHIASRIIKQLLLRVSLRLYDSGFWTYTGPRCACPNLKHVRTMLQRLTFICIIAGVDSSPMWSFTLNTPRLPM